MNQPAAPIIARDKSRIPADAHIIENLESALEEFFFIEHPHFKKRTEENAAQMDAFIEGYRKEDCWVYFSQENIAVHTVSEPLYFRLRTSRNRDIITDDEQAHYRAISVGIAGLSVGSAILQTMVMSGGPKKFKIADFDVLELTNLNRLRADLTDIGKNKTYIAAQKVWALDPFAELALFDNGISRENIEDFILGKPRLDIFIDEMDSIDLKIMARMICRKNGIPVLMATDNGDGVILDVERFDLQPDRKLFHGLIPEMDPEELKELDYRQWFRLATKIVDPEYLTEAMQDSLAELGKKIPSVPQLGASASMAGAVMNFASRRIAAGEPMPSGRYTINIEAALIPGYNNETAVLRRQQKTEVFIKKLSEGS